jgi:hypothetical protein
MAGSFEEAFREIEGAELDLIVGFSILPRKHAPTDAEVRAAFEGFDYRHVDRIVRILSSSHRCDRAHAEDAVHDGLVYLCVRRPELFREDPEGWLGLLHEVAKYRLLAIRSRQGQTASIDQLTELAGDAPFAGARRCVSPSPDADEESRYAPPPRPGEAWNPTQILGAFQRFRDYHGWPPKAKDCRAINGLPSVATICRHFESFADAILAAGMMPDTPRRRRRRRRWGPVEAARACLSFRWRHGYWPGAAEAKRSLGDLPGEKVMNRFFGGTNSGHVQIGAEAILAEA